MPSRSEAPIGTKVASKGGSDPRRPAQRKKPDELDSTARGDRSATAPELGLAVVVSFPSHVARLRARLSADLLRENPDQGELERVWGDRRSA
jgi:hypothetical protein